MAVSRISGSNGGIVLTAGSYTDPVTVTAIGVVFNGDGDGLYAARSWTVDNRGTVDSLANVGIHLAQGGAVANGPGGVVTGHDGVSIEGAFGAVGNFGAITGENYGIYLGAGGAVTNGSPSNSAALVEGSSVNGVAAAAIMVEHGAGRIVNAGTIVSGGDYVAAKYTTYTSPAILLEDGGTIFNYNAAADIATGVSVAGAFGRIVNKGAIGSPEQYYEKTGEFSQVNFRDYHGPSISMVAGGRVINGGSGPVSATISAGVDISGGAGFVVNEGSIGGTQTRQNYYPSYANDRGYSVKMSDGGIVHNGTGRYLSADLGGGVYIAGKTGKVVNDGIIGDPKNLSVYDGNGNAYVYHKVSVFLDAGGTVRNGSPSNTAADIQDGVLISNGAGAVRNYGTIVNMTVPSGAYYRTSTYVAYGVDLNGGGSVVNGSGRDSTALIQGEGFGVEITGGPGRVQNFGTIAAQSGVAVSFDSAADVLIEKRSGVLIGEVAGGGGTLKLSLGTGTGAIGGIGGSITGFGTIEVERGARWQLTGANTIAAGVMMFDAGPLLDNGVLTNDGLFIVQSPLQLSTDGQLVNASGGTIRLSGNAGIFPTMGATGTGLVNAGMLETMKNSGTDTIRTNISDTGRIDVAEGTLNLAGATNSIGGAISGAGTIMFSAGATDLDAGTSISALGLEMTGGAHVTLATRLTYRHAFTVSGAAELTIGGGDALTLTGNAAFGAGTVDGGGRLETAGSATVSAMTLGGTVKWTNTGKLDATGQLTMGDAAVFFNGSGGVFDIMGNTGIAAEPAANPELINSGLLEKTGGKGVSSVAVSLFNNGTVEVATGTLDLGGVVSGPGTLKIDAGAALELGAAVSARGKVDFAGSNAVLRLDDAADFKATVSGFAAGETIDLRSVYFGDGTVFGYFGAGSAGTLIVASKGSQTAQIALLGQYVAGNFQASSDGYGGTDITFVTPPDSTPPALAAFHPH